MKPITLRLFAIFFTALSFSVSFALPQSQKRHTTSLEEYKFAIEQWENNPDNPYKPVYGMVNPGGLYGVMDFKGKSILPAVYDNITDGGEGLLLVRKGPEYSFVNPATGETILGGFDFALPFEDGKARVDKDGREYYINVSGEEIQSDDYIVGKYFDGIALAIDNGKYGFVDTEGKSIVPCIYSDAYIFLDGLAPVEKDGKWGFIDTTGKVVIHFEYDWATNFTDGLACIYEDEEEDYTTGYINKKGKLVFWTDYEMIYPFIGGAAIVRDNYLYGLINKKGKEILPCSFRRIEPIGHGSFKIRSEDTNKFGIVNPQKGIDVGCKYDYISDFTEDIAFAQNIDDRYEAINPFGRQVFHETFEDAKSFSEGLASVKKDGKWGCIDTKGATVIPFQYDNAISFDNGLATVGKEGKYGYIDTKGATVIPFLFEYARNFNKDGFAIITMDGKNGVINRQGEIVAPCIFNNALAVINGVIMVIEPTRDPDW